MEIRGAITALVTPFTKNGGVNYDKLAELIEFQIANGADGLFVPVWMPRRDGFR